MFISLSEIKRNNTQQGYEEEIFYSLKYITKAFKFNLYKEDITKDRLREGRVVSRRRVQVN
jgi:hypothetical protein